MINTVRHDLGYRLTITIINVTRWLS